jgi:superfamily II DNA or RNA helicase
MLNNIQLKHLYSTGTADTPRIFFSQALANSTSFDIGLGFFSSASINVLSVGFAKFISDGGKMRLYINQYVSEDDYYAISSGTTTFEDAIVSDFKAMVDVLSKRDEHFFNCLSYLIYTNRIEIKIIVPKNGGIAHQKFGVFTDTTGNKVVFNGSLNFTASALLSKNIESITCFFSWDGAKELIAECEELFDSFFEGKQDNVFVYDATNFKHEVLTHFPPKDVEKIMDEEETLIRDLKTRSDGHIDLDSVEISNKEPHFPFPTGAFEYQIEANKKWLEHNKSGIFAMATGTGKTITSLNCVLEEYKKTGHYRLLILVPTIDLVNQWIEEVAKFKFRNVYVVNGSTNWRTELTRLKNDFLWGKGSDYVMISTYDSFTNEKFQNLVEDLRDEYSILIADEAHNVGSASVRAAFATLKISQRIALSATPNRAYDYDGTKAIEEFFHDEPPYCYSFSMERAIRENKLMEYLYYPRLAHLDYEEMAKYKQLTQRLLRFYNPSSKSFDQNPEVKRLLMQRKSIIHKTQDKYRAFESIIDELSETGKTKYCFVYTPEGIDYQTSDNGRIMMKMKGIVDKKYPDIRTNTYIGGDTNKKEKLRAFAEGKIDMLFAMKCLDEGVDVPRAEVGIFTSSTGNPRQFIQRRGRLLRKHPEKRFAIIYDIIVAPDFEESSSSEFEMEKSLVKSELTRVAYFASLASNYNQAELSLKSILDHYEFELSSLIKELQEQ